LPSDAARSLENTALKVFKGDKTKVSLVKTQFEYYWQELGEFKQHLTHFRAEMETIVKRDKTSAEDLEKMRPLEKMIHNLKLQPVHKVIAYFATWVIRIAPELVELVVIMFSITAGCVRVERSVKIQKMVHSKVRNRLLHSKVEKLVQIYMNARLSSKVKADITALEDMTDPSSEAKMEEILGDLVTEAVQVVEAGEEVVIVE